MRGRRWTAEEKMSIVLEGLRGDKSISELCSKHGISQSQYYKWRDIFLEGGKSAFENGNKTKEKILEDKVKELESIIGKQTIVIETLKKMQAI